jgi:two-component system response regulator
MTTIVSRFGASVRGLRNRLGISQAVLAERAALHQTYIAGIEGGHRNVTLKSIEKLALALQVSVATLLSSEASAQRNQGAANQKAAIGEYIDILMVEDDREDCELALKAFKEAGIRNPVHVVRDGTEALNYLFFPGGSSKRKVLDVPKLVLLDLSLPGISGVEILRKIKSDQRTKSIPVVILTATRDAKILRLCLELGAACYITKPCNFLGLSQVVPQLNLGWALLKPLSVHVQNEPRVPSL